MLLFLNIIFIAVIKLSILWPYSTQVTRHGLWSPQIFCRCNQCPLPALGDFLQPTASYWYMFLIKRNRNKSCSSDCPFSTFRLLIISGAELAKFQHGDLGLAQVQGFWCLYFESYRCLDFLFWILWAVIRKRRCAPYSRVLQPPGSNI